MLEATEAIVRSVIGAFHVETVDSILTPRVFGAWPARPSHDGWQSRQGVTI